MTASQTDFRDKMHEYAALTESYMKRRIDALYTEPSLRNTLAAVSTLFDSMAYSLFAGGKRLRPFLTLEFCSLCGAPAEKALPFAAAMEMVHTFSLIHDDLPCMDNDDLRRGKPTNHKAFGEATALLAGDALVFSAFECVADSALPAEAAVKAVRLLSGGAGAIGMIAGQQLDMWAEDHPSDDALLTLLQRKKTGALFETAVGLGCLAAGFDETTMQYRAATDFASHFGLAFQITDDLLDVCGDTALLGKSVGSDAQNGKTTFVTLLGLDGARQKAAQEASLAKSALDVFQKADTSALCRLTDYLSERNN